MTERDLSDLVREYEENGGDTSQWEVDTCGVCGCHFLVANVKSEYREESVCGYKCFTVSKGEGL